MSNPNHQEIKEAKEWLESGDEYDKRLATIILAALEVTEKERDELLQRCSAMRDHLNVNLQRLDASRDYTDQLEKERDEWKEKAGLWCDQCNAASEGRADEMARATRAEARVKELEARRP